MHLRPLELGWCAGLFDGEGCVHLRHYPNPKKHPAIISSVVLTHQATVKRFHKLVGTGNFNEFDPCDLKRAKKYIWQATNKEAIFVLKLLKEAAFLKLPQIELALEFASKCPIGNRFWTMEQEAFGSKCVAEMSILNQKGPK